MRKKLIIILFVIVSVVSYSSFTKTLSVNNTNKEITPLAQNNLHAAILVDKPANKSNNIASTLLKRFLDDNCTIDVRLINLILSTRIFYTKKQYYIGFQYLSSLSYRTQSQRGPPTLAS
ncbi:MAG TPA: hypothetical protein VK705_04105 [Ferruginibacter sp.]|jgi:hypothetical protein|nr:hypothetical protein [Ferruginibacter sp.]